MTDLKETGWQGETNPGGYQGPELTDIGIVTDNSDLVTHTPETPAEWNARKKKKELLSKKAEKGDPSQIEEDTSISLEALLNDPEFLQRLMAEMSKFNLSSQIEATVVKNLSYLVLEDFYEV
jgi:hypothetical protein